MKEITTLCGTKVKVDQEIFDKYSKYSWRIPYEGIVSSSHIIDGKRERNLRSLVLGLDESDLRRTVYYKDGDRYNLTKENLSMTNVTIIIVNDHYKACLPDGICFLFDKVDLPLIESRTWILGKNGYMYGVNNGKHVLLHRELVGFPIGKVVDHVNHNILDNRRSNLNIVSTSDNLFNRKGAQSNNTSGYRGVHKARNGKWVVRFTKNKVTTRLGTYDCVEDAAKVAKDYLDGVGIYATK